MNKLKRHLPSIIFCAFIGIMMILFFVLPKADYSSSEKRYLQSFPELNTSTFFSGQFGKDYEKFLSDHTAGRNFFVGLNAYYNLYSGRNGASGVYKSANDYLINDPVEEEILKDGEKSSLVTNVEVLNDFTAQNNLNTTFMVVPSTGYIMYNTLPANHYTYRDDKYFQQIQSASTNMDFVDIRNTFKEKASDTQLFYKTDHHWTTPGAYIAYTELCKALGLAPTAEDNFNKKTYSDFYGTTYSTSAFWFNSPDNIEVWTNKALDSNSISVEIKEGEEVDTYNDMFFYSHLKKDDKYPVFLDGNHAYEKITNSKCTNGKKLLILKDSFAHSLTPFLADHYSEIIMIDPRYYKAPVSDIVKQEGITDALVLYSMENLYTDTDIKWIS